MQLKYRHDSRYKNGKKTSSNSVSSVAICNVLFGRVLLDRLGQAAGEVKNFEPVGEWGENLTSRAGADSLSLPQMFKYFLLAFFDMSVFLSFK